MVVNGYYWQNRPYSEQRHDRYESEAVRQARRHEGAKGGIAPSDLICAPSVSFLYSWLQMKCLTF